ncbi:MAG: FHA domain-containing protein [Deltaproteobacteria bacterium]|nr:FHA domain-containing protein [Deltaproteobacteria bacterium]
MYKLVISDDEGKSTVVPLIRDEVSIGRQEGNTIRLTERNVSRIHARVIREDEVFRIEDLGSLCGTKVNASVLKDESAIVSSGDKITIGDYSLSIRSDVASDVPLGRQMGPGDESWIGKVTPHARLVMLTEPELGREIDLTADLYVIGRSEEANCRVRDTSISRAHARIDLDAGEWTISDLDSVNGITINGMKKDDYVLKAGDIIQLGSVRFRFVAPGEPYEYDASSTDKIGASSMPTRPANRTSHGMLYVLGAVAVAAVIAIVVVVFMLNRKDVSIDEDGEPVDESGEQDTFKSLMERGKDKMQAEEWAAAARLFALALRKKSDSETAREMKQLAIKEADAQKAFTAGLVAAENKDWRKAVTLISKIPRSSHYYDIEQLKKLSGMFCMELLEKAKWAATHNDLPGARRVLDEIGEIPEKPSNCQSKQERMRFELRGHISPDAGSRGKPASSRQSSPKSSKQQSQKTKKPKVGGKGSTGFSNYDNPYATGGKAGSDAVSEAHAAIRTGNTTKAIQILEKGGNGRAVLLLLSRLYMKVGDRAGYERVARKFIRFYPNDSKAAQFKQNLQF